LFGVSGTPGNVIVDKQTGKFILIPGAYPPEKFIEEIEKMKAE
jgi:thioredoxin-related protein